MLGEELLLITPPRPSGALALDELSGVPFVGYRRGSALRDTVDRALRAAAATPEIVFESDELVSVRELVARSLGVSIVPRSTVDGDGPPVAAIPIGLERPLTLVWRERRQPPAAGAFLSFVRRGGCRAAAGRGSGGCGADEAEPLRELRLRALREDRARSPRRSRRRAARPLADWASWAADASRVIVVAIDGERWVGMVAGRLLERAAPG